MKVCKADCDRPALLSDHGFCRIHKRRLSAGKTGDKLYGPIRTISPKGSFKICVVVDCHKKGTAGKGYCATHFYRYLNNLNIESPINTWNRNVGFCIIGSCKSRAATCGMCNKHYHLSRTQRLSDFQIERFENITECMVCSNHFSGIRDKHLDHCHIRNYARGALCQACNLAIGMMRDNVDKISFLISYLETVNNFQLRSDEDICSPGIIPIDNICSIFSCNKKHNTGGYCKAHYAKWMKYKLSFRQMTISEEEVRCHSCRADFSQFISGSKSKCIDHCHETQKVRGILCRECNIALGHFKDNIERMEKAIDYLLRSRL